MQNPILFFLSSLIKLLSSQIVLERKTWPTIGSFSWIFVLEPTVSCRQENAERNAKSQLVASRGEGKVHAGGLRKPRPPRRVPDHAGRSRSLSATRTRKMHKLLENERVPAAGESCPRSTRFFAHRGNAQEETFMMSAYRTEWSTLIDS